MGRRFRSQAYTVMEWGSGKQGESGVFDEMMRRADGTAWNPHDGKQAVGRSRSTVPFSKASNSMRLENPPRLLDTAGGA